MDEIASEAGISKRTLYEQFSDKEELLVCCMQRWEKNGQYMMEEFSKTTLNTLEILLKIHHFQSEQMVQLSIDLVSDIKKYYPQVFKNTILVSREHHRERTKAFLLRGQEEGLFRRDINIDLINELFEAMMYHLVHYNRGALIQKYSYGEFFRCSVICFIRGISTEKGIRYLDANIIKYDNEM